MWKIKILKKIFALSFSTNMIALIIFLCHNARKLLICFDSFMNSLISKFKEWNILTNDLSSIYLLYSSYLSTSHFIFLYSLFSPYLLQPSTIKHSMLIWSMSLGWSSHIFRNLLIFEFLLIKVIKLRFWASTKTRKKYHLRFQSGYSNVHNKKHRPL